MEFLTSGVNALVYLVCSFALFFIGRVFYKLFNKKINVEEELVIQDNFAFSLSHTGYLIGVVLVIGGAILGPSTGLVDDVMQIFIYGVIGIVLLNVSLIINDKVILNKFHVYEEIIEQKNIGTGVVEAASCISTGLVLFASIHGDSFSQSGIVSVLLFWGIGQAIMVLTGWVYNLITPYDIHEHILKKNTAVGIGFAGALVAIGNLIRFGLSGDFYNWEDLIYSLVFEVFIGLLFLPIARFACDKILLPRQKLTDEIVNQDKPNLGAAVIEAFSYIGGSILLTWSL